MRLLIDMNLTLRWVHFLRHAGYEAALDGQDPRVFLIALHNVTQTQGGIAKVAAHSA
jgi:predicted nuclease of predicted toxin-antitoxin system